jgi:hypothetical protein
VIQNADTKISVLLRILQCVPLATEPGWLADRCSVSQQSGALQTHTTDTFFFISHTTNVLLFKFRCNIFIGVRIIKQMPVSVASGIPILPVVSKNFLSRNYSTFEPCYNTIGLCDTSSIVSDSVWYQLVPQF